MFRKRNLSAVAFALAIVAPLSAQVVSGPTGEAQTARRRAEEARQRSEAVLTRTRMDSIRNARTQESHSRSGRIPPGQLPPRGMCRVWIDGTPPGQQPPVTSCAQAEQDRIAYGANARVIYGDQQAFPGRGHGKFKNRSAHDDDDNDDDDRFENDRRSESSVSRAAKPERKAERKAARKGGKGRG